MSRKQEGMKFYLINLLSFVAADLKHVFLLGPGEGSGNLKISKIDNKYFFLIFRRSCWDSWDLHQWGGWSSLRSQGQWKCLSRGSQWQNCNLFISNILRWIMLNIFKVYGYVGGHIKKSSEILSLVCGGTDRSQHVSANCYNYNQTDFTWHVAPPLKQWENISML